MLTAAWLRVAVAALVTTWSPAHLYCCCAAKADSKPVPERVESSCCVAEASGDTACREAADRRGCDNTCDGNGCGCLHGPVDAPVPVATVLAGHGASDLDDADPILELSPVLAEAFRVNHWTSCRGSPVRPPPHTLLALGCLLTT